VAKLEYIKVVIGWNGMVLDPQGKGECYDLHRSVSSIGIGLPLQG
jgi:hypothetical protein